MDKMDTFTESLYSLWPYCYTSLERETWTPSFLHHYITDLPREQRCILNTQIPLTKCVKPDCSNHKSAISSTGILFDNRNQDFDLLLGEWNAVFKRMPDDFQLALSLDKLPIVKKFGCLQTLLEAFGHLPPASFAALLYWPGFLELFDEIIALQYQLHLKMCNVNLDNRYV